LPAKKDTVSLALLAAASSSTTFLHPKACSIAGTAVSNSNPSATLATSAAEPPNSLRWTPDESQERLNRPHPLDRSQAAILPNLAPAHPPFSFPACLSTTIVVRDLG